MRLNWFGYWNSADGYGRFNTRMISALQSLGADVRAIHIGELDRPTRLGLQLSIDWERLNISCMPPYMLKKIPGKHWLFSMTEGSRVPPSWIDKMYGCDIDMLLVPCEHNAKAFRDSGWNLPIRVVPGGTDPVEFPLIETGKRRLEDYRPYTFLTFADRGFRKGWDEARDAFYLAFGGKTTGVANARLIIKGRKHDKPSLIEVMSKAMDLDTRVQFLIDDLEDMRELYSKVDCLVLPSRSEGWGMIHREAACSGLPVITQQYAGMDDGHTSEWAMVVRGLRTEEIPNEVATALGEWSIPDKEDIAQKMKYCFHSPETAAAFGRQAAAWIRAFQTWEDSAQALVDLLVPVRERGMVRQYGD